MTNTPIMRALREAFFTGFLVTIPAIVSIICVVWLFDLLTALVPPLANLLLPVDHHDLIRDNLLALRIIGLCLLLGTITGVGLLTRHFIGQALLRRFEEIMMAVPLVRPIYSTVRQIAHALSASKEEMFRSVVLIEYPRLGSYALGFVTADAPPEFSRGKPEDLVGVFLPTTPNPTSGFLLYLPRRQLQVLTISVAEAMRLIISGGVIRPGMPIPGTKVPAAPPPSSATPNSGAP